MDDVSLFILIFIKGVHNLNKIIIIGAVAGGATCASQIRRLDKERDYCI